MERIKGGGVEEVTENAKHKTLSVQIIFSYSIN